MLMKQGTFPNKKLFRILIVFVVFLTALFFISTFTQYSYFKNQLYKHAENQLTDRINVIAKEVTPTICSISDFEKTITSNFILISDECGFVAAEDVLTPGYLPGVESFDELIYPTPTTISNNAGEWRVLTKKLSDGKVLLSVPKEDLSFYDYPSIDKKLENDSLLFGSTTESALAVQQQTTNSSVSNIIFDNFGRITGGFGEVPIKVNQESFNNIQNNTKVYEQKFDNTDYLLLVKRIFTADQKHSAILIVRENIQIFATLLRNQLIFNIFIALISLTILLFITIKYFNKAENEHLKMLEAFKGYFSPHILNKILNEESVTLGGTHREITVLFSDIASFTKISEEIPAKKLVNLLQEYFTAMTEEIFATDGTVDKYIGDSIMAFWGAPIDQPDQADRAVTAAINMMKRLEKLKAKWLQEGYPIVDTRIGINTGVMLAGNIGSDKRFDYTVIGHEVNVSSRLEQLNKEYGSKIIISDSTRKRLSIPVNLESLKEITVRGTSMPIKIYKVKI